MEIKWKDLFPNTISVLVFISYIVLFVNQGILVTASQNSGNNYNYDIVTVVLLTEVLKLTVSVALYCRNNSISNLFKNVIDNRKVLGLYLIPAFLYCLYNNLSFVNLSAFDPTTYYLLLQLRVVITAIIFQVIFRRNLTYKQWISLFLLTIGCMLKQVNFTDIPKTNGDVSTQKSFKLDLNINAIFILIQTGCSCLAGVYNEYLLKEPGANVDIYVQNVFMYIDSILCNLILLLVQGNLLSVFGWNSLSTVFEIKVILVMVNNAAIGIITSFFLKNLNSILKTFASALELVLTAIFCYLLLGIPVYLNTLLSIVVVMLAIFLYSQNPISNATRDKREDEELLMEKV